jgi:hypothetical protein
MSRLKIIIASTLILVLASLNVDAQTFQDFKNEIREEYDTFEAETQQKFNDFVLKIDQEFSSYLIDNFGEHNIRNEKREIENPKPENIPIAEESIISGDILKYKTAETTNSYQGPVFPSIKKVETIGFAQKQIDVSFLGWPLIFNLDKEISNVSKAVNSSEGISNYWTEMSKINYNHFLFQISDVANTLNLNQWGYFQLLKECSKSIYPANSNMQVLFQWAMLSRSRYKVKVGFNENDIFLLIPSVYKMYNLDFVRINGSNYYLLAGKGNTIQTYEKDFPEADILMDVRINKPFNTYPIKKSKDFNFEYDGRKFNLNLKYDQQMIEFYKTIPLSDIRVYFNSIVSDRTKMSIQKAFEPVLKGKSDIESANILLSFVQQAFDYKTDQQVFGTEKYFFPDELLHYQYADCEDRSVLYAYLVKTLLNKEVVALGFPGHMATAVGFSEDVEGMNFTFNNNYYVVADPTYYGAPLGVILSSVANEKAEVFALENNTVFSDIARQAWEKTNEYGGFKADKLVDIVVDKKSNIYLCGYFNGEADFDGMKIKGSVNDRDVFVVKYNRELIPQWVKAATGKGNDIAFSMAMDDEGSVYVYGSFENELNFSGIEIVANDAPDVFVAKISENGDLQWMKKAGIDKIDHSLDFMFAAMFNTQGEKIMAKLYSQTEDFNHYGIELDESGNALIKGSFFATSGMSSNDYVNYNIGTDLDIPVVLHETDLKLKQNEYETTIAGLFSAMNLLKANTIEIEGLQIKNTFDQYNSNFKNYASGIYSKLSNMKFIKNEKGIVRINSLDGNSIVFENIKIDDGARIRIVKYKSGNIKVETLTGIYVGGDDYWLNMNSIKLFKESGDLLFDFDTDNSVQKINLKSQILKR